MDEFLDELQYFVYDLSWELGYYYLQEASWKIVCLSHNHKSILQVRIVIHRFIEL